MSLAYVVILYCDNTPLPRRSLFYYIGSSERSIGGEIQIYCRSDYCAPMCKSLDLVQRESRVRGCRAWPGPWPGRNEAGPGVAEPGIGPGPCRERGRGWRSDILIAGVSYPVASKAHRHPGRRVDVEERIYCYRLLLRVCAAIDRHRALPLKQQRLLL